MLYRRINKMVPACMILQTNFRVKLIVFIKYAPWTRDPIQNIPPPPEICGYNRNTDKATSFLNCYAMPTG